MTSHHNTLFLIVSLVASFFILEPANGSVPKFQDLIGDHKSIRRILHQPLFPASSPPPPAVEPPPTSVYPNPDQPFFPEVPTGPTPNQAQQPPAAINGTGIPIPIATQPAKPTKIVAIAISVGIVTLGMLSGLAFYLYKHRVKHPDESQKLVGGNSQRVNEESRMPPSTFLYIGNVEPSSQRTVDETNGSPYQKLSSSKKSDRYRPSPDLQPLPPLSKPQPQPIMNSPAAISSSDEESHESAFYTPQGSSVSNEEGYSTSSRQSRLSNNTRTQSRIEPHVTSPIPYSKRTSPKSRLSVSSADTKHAIIPSIKQPPPTPPPQPPPPPPPPIAPSRPMQKQPQVQYCQPTLAYAPRRAKFSSPPPPPDLTALHSINKQTQQTSKIPIPPPPPPPPLPPQLVRLQKLGGSETSVPSMALQQLTKFMTWMDQNRN